MPWLKALQGGCDRRTLHSAEELLSSPLLNSLKGNNEEEKEANTQERERGTNLKQQWDRVTEDVSRIYLGTWQEKNSGH